MRLPTGQSSAAARLAAFLAAITLAGPAATGGSLLPGYQYSIGSPTDEEQAFVELINRARANAYAEGLRLANSTDPDVVSAITTFGVNLTEMINQFSALPQSLPPLSINTSLTSIARLHSQDMFTNVFQGHVSSSNPPSPFSPGDTLAQRVAEFPYTYTHLGENVFAHAYSPIYGHAGFEIDWGYGTYGMQEPPGHRLIIHSANYREIGVGVVLGIKSSPTETVGPLVVTQLFGSRVAPTPFVTGVAYYDLNDNGFYDAGEGIGGMTVETSADLYWATTTASGGYSIPLSGDGNYTVTFTGPALAPLPVPVQISAGSNKKVDLAMEYAPPAISGTQNPLAGVSTAYSIRPVAGATAYSVRVMTGNTSPWSEGAEAGLTNVTVTQSAGYTVTQSERKNSGTFAFHLAHPAGAVDQIIRLNSLIVPTSTSQLQFASRLQYATAYQFAKVEVSTNLGATWTTLYAQSGNGTAGEAAFVPRSIPLASYAGIPIQVRFRYSLSIGYSYFNQVTNDIGWLIDDITVTNSAIATVQNSFQVTSPAFTFTPPSQGSYLLAAFPYNNSRVLPFGPALPVTAGTVTALQAWRTANFSPANLADPAKEATVWGHAADPEKDGVINLFEFALGGNPNLPDAGAVLPQPGREGSLLRLAYVKRRSDATYRVQTNTSLGSSGWTTTGVTQTPDPAYSPEGTPIEATVDVAGGARFLRLEVTVP